MILSTWLAILAKEKDIRVAIEGLEGLEWMLKRSTTAFFSQADVHGVLRYCDLVLRKQVRIEMCCVMLCSTCLS